MTIEQVAIMGIIIVVLYFSIALFFDKFGASAKTLDTQINSLGDCDGDLVQNLYDKCPCPPKLVAANSEPGDILNKGCSPLYKIENSQKGPEDRSCLTKKECM